MKNAKDRTMTRTITFLIFLNTLLPINTYAQLAVEDTPELSEATIEEFERRAAYNAIVAAKAKREPFPNPFDGDSDWQPTELTEEEKLGFPTMLPSKKFKDNPSDTSTEICWAAFRNSKTGELALMSQIISKPMSAELKEEIRQSKLQISRNKAKQQTLREHQR